MRFGRVIGKLVLNHQDEKLSGSRWLVVSPMGKAQFENLKYTGPSAEPSCVVYDNLGAAVGDIIGFTEGGEATLPFDKPMPIDSYNAAIIERVNYVGMGS